MEKMRVLLKKMSIKVEARAKPQTLWMVNELFLGKTLNALEQFGFWKNF